MTRYAAFLRGINVGGHRVNSTELCACLDELGFSGVATFRASGNVILEDVGDDGPDEVAGRVERALGESLGYEVPVFLRTAAEVRSIAGHDPFPPRLVKASDGKLQVLLLPKKPAAQVKKAVLALATQADPLVFGARELYWLPSGPMMDSPLDLKAIETMIGPTTTRTKGTIDHIAAKHFAD